MIKSAYTWTHAVQTHVVQRSTVHTSAIAAMITFNQHQFYKVYQVNVINPTLYEVLGKEKIPFIEHYCVILTFTDSAMYA